MAVLRQLHDDGSSCGAVAVQKHGAITRYGIIIMPRTGRA